MSEDLLITTNLLTGSTENTEPSTSAPLTRTILTIAPAANSEEKSFGSRGGFSAEKVGVGHISMMRVRECSRREGEERERERVCF